MSVRFLCVTVAFFAAVLVLETIAVRPRLARQKFLQVNCEGTCKRRCLGTFEVVGEGQCRLNRKCCKKIPVPEDFFRPVPLPGCSTYGGSCRVVGKKGKCPDTEAAVRGAPCPNKSAKCCMTKPENSEFEDGIFQITGGLAIYQQDSRVITGPSLNQNDVRVESNTRSRGLRRNRSRRLY